MSHRVYADDRLVLGSEANSKDNIYGNPSYNKVVVYDDFTGADISSYWTQTEDNGGTVAIATGAAANSGAFTITTDVNDDDRGILTGSLNWYPAKNPVMEARVMVDRITLCSFGVGFTDATTEGNDVQPFSVSGATVTDTANNGAAIVFDTDATTDYFWIVNSLATAEGGSILPSTRVPVASTYITLRVAIDTAGGARYYINGEEVGYKALATTTTTALCPYISCINRAGAALVLTCDYIKVWQDR
jgi:hypothetical protein